MGFDLGKIETKQRAEDGVDFEIVDAAKNPVVDDAGKPLTIKMGGADSARIKNLVRDRQRRRKEQFDEAKAAAEKAGVEFVEPQYTWVEREAEMVEDLVILTLGWSSNIELDGKPFPFSTENAETLYKRFPEIAEQMTQKASFRVNFLPTASKS